MQGPIAVEWKINGTYKVFHAYEAHEQWAKQAAHLVGLGYSVRVQKGHELARMGNRLVARGGKVIMRAVPA